MKESSHVKPFLNQWWATVNWTLGNIFSKIGIEMHILLIEKKFDNTLCL